MPSEYHISQTDVLDEFDLEDKQIELLNGDKVEFNAFTLLDPIKKDEQVWYGLHVGFG
jgi:hypothetical protein